jgi:hypothetical protein
LISKGVFEFLAAPPRCWKKCQSPAMPNGRCRLHGGLLERELREIAERSGWGSLDQVRAHGPWP